MEGWQWNPAWTYLLLHEGVLPETLTERFPAFVDRYFPESFKAETHLALQPLTDIHLHSRLHYEIAANGDAAYVSIISVTALFLLLISCINFMNLKTARSARRAREVGMRKVLGARRMQLARQFLGEAVLMSFLALLAALPLIYVCLPFLNQLVGKQLAFDLFRDSPLALTVVGVTALVGVCAGLYPALFLSAFLEDQWHTFLPDHPYDYFFLDDDLDQMYKGEATLSVVIACLGLFGLAAFSAEQRTREVGIRKVVGASVAGLVLLLSKEFVRLVGVAILVAWPLAYFVLDRWRAGFAFRVDIAWSTFLLAGLTALVIAWVTVSYQAVRAALTNPVEALRYQH